MWDPCYPTTTKSNAHLADENRTAHERLVGQLGLGALRILLGRKFNDTAALGRADGRGENLGKGDVTSC
jgi:hypothetical protein